MNIVLVTTRVETAHASTTQVHVCTDVGGEDDERVVQYALLRELVDHPADRVVHRTHHRCKEQSLRLKRSSLRGHLHRGHPQLQPKPWSSLWIRI